MYDPLYDNRWKYTQRFYICNREGDDNTYESVHNNINIGRSGDSLCNHVPYVIFFLHVFTNRYLSTGIYERVYNNINIGRIGGSWCNRVIFVQCHTLKAKMWCYPFD